jgi:hypothetical protein
MLQCQDRLPEAEEARTLKNGDMRPEKSIVGSMGLSYYHSEYLFLWACSFSIVILVYWRV